MEFNFTIKNDELKSVAYPKGVTGNVNTYMCIFDIECTIEGLTWFCVFKQGSKIYNQLIEDNMCVMPYEVLTATEPLYIGCYGTNADNNIKRVSTNFVYFEVKQGAYSEANAPEAPTPDVWEELIKKSVPYIGDNWHWYVYDFEIGKYVDTGVSARGSGEMGDEIDPTVPEWAKQPTKPKYTAEEVGALPRDTEIITSEYVKTYVDEQTEIIKSDVEGLQIQINEEAHFRGYLSTNVKIQALEATPNDFAYSAESGTVWIYDAEKGWEETDTPVPDKGTPLSNATPLINGEASAGHSEEGARSDHRHPTDTTRASVEDVNDLKRSIGTALDNIIAIQNSLIGGDA